MHGTWLSLVSILLAGCASSRSLMMVTSPLVDLRAKPHTSSTASTHDDLQETQLLYGERVRLLRERDGWAYVEALEQPEWSHAKRWQGYPGWVPLSSLGAWQESLEPSIVVTRPWTMSWYDAYSQKPSPWRFAMGTYLPATRMGNRWRLHLWNDTTVWIDAQDAHALAEVHALSRQQKRERIIQNALKLIGHPYYWGGRSPHMSEESGWVTGVDCSGLVNLAYRSIDMELPRDAHEQFLRATVTEKLQPADLVFLSERNDPKRIVHVMLYVGDNTLIEAPGTNQSVRRIPLEERLGGSAEQLVSGRTITGDDRTIFLGTYLF